MGTSVARPVRTLRTAVIVAAVVLLAAGARALDARASEPGPAVAASPAFIDLTLFNGAQLQHAIPGGSEHLSQPDDIAALHGHLFVAFQNGVGPQGQASSTGNLDSTVVELDRLGRVVDEWDITGKCDGLAADPATGEVIATVNEDANSSLYTIDPGSGAVVHYTYNQALPSAGGTDAITIHDGVVLISASAPGTTGAAAPQPYYPAVYRVDLDAATKVASVTPVFFDEATATNANLGSTGTTQLMLTDPDSNENVPFSAPRFGGDFMLTSQGDQQQIFVSDPGGPRQTLSVLNLSTAVDDTAWPSGPWGALYVTDHGNNAVDVVLGFFRPRSVLVAATPCDASNAPSTCPGPGFPANYLGELNPWTGAVTAVKLYGAPLTPQGMVFLP